MVANIQLFDAELRAATIEAKVRDEITADMAKRMMDMEKLFSSSLQRNSEMHELKTNKQIDILQSYRPQVKFHQVQEAQEEMESDEGSSCEYDEEVDQSLVGQDKNNHHVPETDTLSLSLSLSDLPVC